MKLNKKILSTALASTMVLGSMSTAFAAVPAGSILLGDKAFKLEYLTEEHSDEINNAFEAGGFDFKYKDYDGTWVDGLNNAIDPATLPAVEFKNVDGSTTNYEAGDGDEVSETATIESVEAITTTKLRVKFSNKIDGANSANFAIDGLTVTNASIQADMQTVDITTSPVTPESNYTLTATGIMVGGETQEVMTKAFTAPVVEELYSGTQLVFEDEDGILAANGEDATTVTFELRDGEGNLVEDAGEVIVEFTSTFGEFAENRITVENGKAKVLFVSTTLTSAKTALLRGTIVDATDQNLRNIEAKTTLVLDPNPDTGGDITLGARITDAEAEQADRVYAYFDKKVTPEMYLDDNGAVDTDKAKFTVYNDTTNTNNPLEVVGILPIEDNEKGLQLLLDTDNDGNEKYLTANSMVKVELTDKTGNVNLDSSDTFKFTDKDAPEIAGASVEGLTKLRVVFTEAISSINDEIDSTDKDMSAETIANWTIDGIRLDNAKWGEATAATAEVVGFTDGEDKRHIVEITLGTDADGDQIYFTPGLHSVQGSNMGDWAAVTDINELNRLNTQSIDFNVEADETKPVPTVEVQSPEQWLVNFNSPVKTDANFTDMIKLEKYNTTSGQWETASNSAVMNNLLDNDKLDIVVTEIKDSSNLVTSILVETDLDWTNVYETPSTLENYYQDKYRLSISAAAVTNPSNGLANDAALLSLSGSIMENDDDNSPMTTSIVEASDDIKTANTIDKTQQAYVATISEPIKLITDKLLADNETVNKEGATDSAYAGYDGNDDWTNISTAKAQFVRTADKKTYAGKVLTIVDEFDKEVLIVPVDENDNKVNLPAGEWKLTLTGLEDDVRNTISTTGQLFTVEGETVEDSDFEILWMYDDLDAIGNGEEAYIRNTGKADADVNNEEDAVYVKFSKPVRTSGDGRVDNAKFTLNGAQLPQGAYVRANIEGYDDHDNVTDSVTIMLPDGTISKTGNTIIQVSPEIKSTEGEKVKNPGEHILPYMWTSMTVDNATDLEAAINDSKVRTINISNNANIGTDVTVDRLVDINIVGDITGTLKVDTEETGKMVLNAAAAATIENVTVDAPNADFVVGADVTVDTLTVNDLYSNSLENNGVIDTLSIKDDTSVINNKTINTLTVEKNKEVELTVGDDGNVPTLEGEGTIKGNGDDTDTSKVLDARAISTTIGSVGDNLVVTFAEELPSGVELRIDSGAGYGAEVTVSNKAVTIANEDVTGAVYFKYTSGDESVTEVVYGN